MIQNSLTPQTLAALLGEPESEIRNNCGELFKSFDLSYRPLTLEELKKNLFEVLCALDEGIFSVSGKHRQQDWEKGWSENFNDFISRQADLQALIPYYIQKSKIKRLFNNYILPNADSFEVNFYTLYRTFIFKKYLAGFDNVFEFGCGTGYNLAIMASLFPGTNFFGLDWSESATQLVNAIGKSHNLKLSGQKFDFYNPDQHLNIPANSAVITLNSLEQIGEDHADFLRFLLEKRPAKIINCEPILELYAEDDLLDHLAIRYHKARNYLSGYLNSLQLLQDQGLVRIEKIQRVAFGNCYHEGYSIVIWEPI